MKINPRTYEAYQLLHDGTLAFCRAEQQGLRLDSEYAERKKTQITRRIERMEKEFKSTEFFDEWVKARKGKINIYSGTQLRDFLYIVKKYKPEHLTDSGLGATDEDALGSLGIPELTNLIEIKKLKKVRDTYLEGFTREQVDGYIHPFFNLHLVSTFRSSSDSPNFQNIPKRDEESMQMCRRALLPRPGHQLLEVDFSGAEVRIAACYHKDPTMLKYIKNPASDMHADMAKQIFMIDKFDKKIPAHHDLRFATKSFFIFAQFYGDYYVNCAKNLCDGLKLPAGKWTGTEGIEMPDGTLAQHLRSQGIKSLDMFTAHLKEIEHDFWHKRFPEYTEWKDRWWNVYKKHGYIDTLSGFRCGGVMDSKQVINFPIQGSSFHCMLWSFIQLDRIMQEENWDTKLVSQIHDSIIFDVNPEELEHVKKVVRRVTCEDLPKAWEWICIPMDVEMELCPIDGSWANKEKLKV
jgi:DNA polymerase I-like protein with 3'-5' exonuclease and polymerase domains